jgi:hypothetical protein
MKRDVAIEALRKFRESVEKDHTADETPTGIQDMTDDQLVAELKTLDLWPEGETKIED